MYTFKNKTRLLYMLLLMMWCAIIPVIVKSHFYANPLKHYEWYPQTETNADFFLFWKMVLITMTGIVMCIILAKNLVVQYGHKKNAFWRYQIFIPLAGYAMLCILSALFSEYPSFCFTGMPDMFETLWVLLAYVVACVFFYWYIRKKNDLDSVVFCLIVGGLLAGAICVLQFFHADIYRFIYSGDGYSFNFEPGVVYGPFYNINYVGSYVVLLLPLFFILALKTKNIVMRILATVAIIFLAIAIYGAESITGEIALVAILLFAVWYLILRKLKQKKVCITFIAVSLIALVAIIIVALPYINSWLKATDTQKTDLEHVYTWPNNVEIDYKGHKLFIDMIDEGTSQLTFALTDENGDIVETTYVTANAEYEYYYYLVEDERFPNFVLVPSLYSEDPIQYAFQLTCNNSSWIFSKDVGDDGSYYWMNGNMVWTKLTEENDSLDGALFGNMSSLANGRGFIWNKTLPLLKDTVILGSGPDTYALVFPNDDYVDLYNNGYQNMFHVKAHNMYLQTAVQTGILSLICWLIFYVWYFVDSLRIYCRVRLDNTETACGFAIMLGTLGYMIAGLANDSSVTVAPIYWCLLGMGIGINYREWEKLNIKTKR